MIDHLLGRPDPRYRKYQVLAVVALWSALVYVQPQGPRPVSKLTRFFGRRLTLWQGIVLTCLAEYVRRNFKRIVPFLDGPEPLANMYSRDYFRATWVTTALDAGFWTAMRIRPQWLREIASIVFTGYYLVCAEAADEVVRKVRGKLSLQHLRISWNKGTTPVLAWFGNVLRPKRLRMNYHPRRIRIPRPPHSQYKDPVHAWLYYDGALSELKNHDKVILDVPGGGFVAMDPRCHDDKLMTWAVKTGFPVVSLDYKKAPEYPYPYALNECFDVYYSIVSSRGRLIGLPGDQVPKIVLSGDSAGGNLAAGVVLMILQSRVDGLSGEQGRQLPLPEAVMLIYPALDVNMSSWLTDEQSALIKDPTRRKANKGVVRRKTEDWTTITNSPYPSDDEDSDVELRMTKRDRRLPDSKRGSITMSPTDVGGHRLKDPTTPIARASSLYLQKQFSLSKARHYSTRIEMSSMISYVDDRILSPEMLRAMVILYMGQNKRPDFTTEYLLSPLRAPEELLREFPKVYMLTGERDPLVDDTALFAGRLLEAHSHKFQERQEAGLIPSSAEFQDENYVKYEIIPGVSHGFLQFALVYDKGYQYIEQCSTWMKEAFEDADKRENEDKIEADSAEDYFKQSSTPEVRRRLSRKAFQIGDGDDLPLEMPSSHLSSANLNKPIRIDTNHQGRHKRPAFSGRKSPVATRSKVGKMTLTPVGGEILPRRMNGVTGGLAGEVERPTTPS